MHFQGQGWSRPVYFTILISHTILAIAIVPLVIITLSRALRERFDQHRADCALDVSAVAVRVGDRGGDLLDAVSLVCGLIQFIYHGAQRHGEMFFRVLLRVSRASVVKSTL